MARWTTSTRSSASIASKDSYGSGRFSACAFAFARSWLEPTTPVTSMPRRRSASTWTTPMNPVPATAARMCLNERRLSSLLARRVYQRAAARALY